MGWFSKEIEPEMANTEIEQQLIERMKKALVEVNNCWAEARKYGFNLKPWVIWEDKRVVPVRTYRDVEEL